ncbi:hypothetical protein E2C01_020456 [Portunus trituberculatus]|uniref:Uncharacterized protein n=1 Tax=Portunus trituberculatus TaxID=210409 RepID=A0A5B7E1J5_PORTR|nr:hypothetical protein [Portunus trituberculatus]
MSHSQSDRHLTSSRWSPPLPFGFSRTVSRRRQRRYWEAAHARKSVRVAVTERMLANTLAAGDGGEPGGRQQQNSRCLD